MQVVIIGGHLDSVGSSTTGRSPGADDDASGSASVLEVCSPPLFSHALFLFLFFVICFYYFVKCINF